MGRFLFYRLLFLFVVAQVSLAARADDVLFIGNSFTFADQAPVVMSHGGVPALFAEIAKAKGKKVTIFAVTAPGKDWTYHLAQPATEKALAKTWSWVVLQDFSTRPTRLGSVKDFLSDGETFSERISKKSPGAGIALYETWPRPPGAFYESKPGNAFSGPGQMMEDLHQAYAQLGDDLAKNKNRPARVARVGTAFAEVEAKYPEINVNASDAHHATAEGYYLAALVIYESIYGESVKDAPREFFDGKLTFSVDVAQKLEAVADEVSGRAVK